MEHTQSEPEATYVDPKAPPKIPGATLVEVEDYVIRMTLESLGYSTSAAAKALGCSVRKLQTYIAHLRKTNAQIATETKHEVGCACAEQCTPKRRAIMLKPKYKKKRQVAAHPENQTVP